MAEVSAPQPAVTRGRAAVGDARGYEFRFLAINELPLLNELYNRCYRFDRPLAEAQWLYRDNPNGPAVVSAAFDDRGRLAGMRPAVAWKVFWQGRERTAYQFTDALVAPEHRNRGIFTQLVKQMCAWAERNDLALFSLPNDNSRAVYQRTSLLQPLGACELWVKPISWPRYIGYLAGRHDSHTDARAGGAEAALSDGDVSLLPAARFESDFEQVHSELAHRALSFTVRRREFLNWRYFGSPVREYRVAVVEQRGQARGYLVLRLIDGIAHLIDVFLVPDAELVGRAFRLLSGWAKQLGAIAIHFKSSEGNFFQRAFSRCGSWGMKRPGSIVLDHRSLRPAGREHTRPAVRDFYFVMGDFDFY